MLVLLLQAGARVDTHEALVQQLLSWEKARKAARDVLQQVRLHGHSVQEEPSSTSIFKAADDEDRLSVVCEYVHPPFLGQRDDAHKNLLAGEIVPMTPLIAAVSSRPHWLCPSSTSGNLNPQPTP